MKKENNLSGMLLQLSLISIGFLVFRIFRSDSLSYIFLAWNLFLAWIPFLLSNYGMKQKTHAKFSFTECISILCWLAFLPNAPYILTDFIHLRSRPHLPFWFDLLLLFSFALTGLLLFLFSFHQFSTKILRSFKDYQSRMITYGLFCLCGYGLYLGRCLRFNSWDIVSDPFTLFNAVIDSFFHPGYFKETITVSVLFGLFLYFGYKVFLIILYHTSADHEQKLLR